MEDNIEKNSQEVKGKKQVENTRKLEYQYWRTDISTTGNPQRRNRRENVTKEISQYSHRTVGTSFHNEKAH